MNPEPRTSEPRSPDPLRRKPRHFWQAKSFWARLETFSKVLMPLVLATVGYFVNRTLAEAKEAEQDTRVFTELMTKREESDVTLRKGMFESVMKEFLEKQPGSPERDLLSLELLVHNFNETLDLKPLFHHVQSSIQASKSNRAGLQARLIQLATEVSNRELQILAEAGAVARLDFDYDLEQKTWTGKHEGVVSISRHVTGADLAARPDDRHFSLQVMNGDGDAKQLRVWLQISTPGNLQTPEVGTTFDAGYFDFPMVQNIRLSRGERCAAVVNELSESVARVSLAFFPGSRASLKEKRYYDEVLEELLHARKGLNHPH